ncbi:MAG: TA system VapC family ribonuclease toxin [Vicinamibacterales bacterium]
MSRVRLLDVNMLIAMFEPGHVHHVVAHDWFADNRQHGWATCAVTESGFARILSHPRYGSNARRPAELIGRLQALCAAADHIWWPCAVSLRDERLFNLSAATHRQLTDIYLLGLAHANGGIFATFDQAIPYNAVVGATMETLEVIAAAR